MSFVGLEHGKIAECLREKEFMMEVPRHRQEARGERERVRGYGLKSVLLEGQVDAYFR